MFDEGQKLGDPYSRTKFESEKLVREECKVPWRVYRPGIVVGHSQTGEMDKIDGPYYFFKVIQRLRGACRRGCPVVGLEGGTINIVPVDFVAAAMDHIAHQDGLDGQAFHLTDPNPKTAGQVINVFARAARARGRDADRPPDDERGAEAGAPHDRPAAAGEAHHRPGAAATSASRARCSPISTTRATTTAATRSARSRAPASGARARGLRRPALGLLGAQPRPGPVQGPLPAGRDRGEGRRDHRRLERHRQGRRA